jgi:NitT/TauT family transport system ATP-binding protein
MVDLKKLQEENILHLIDVKKQYDNLVVLDDIDLSIGYNEFCTVVGPSGHGKSTLLRLILGQELPTSGNIYIENKKEYYANRDRGIVYQKYTLFPHLTVLKNILLGKKLITPFWKWPQKKKQFTEEAFEFLKKVNLEKHYHKYPHQLSGGMQQRVAILQALIMKPKILLMDEPFGALDPGTREDMQIYLLELWKETKMTVLFVTHDLEEAVFLGTRILTVSKYYSDDREINQDLNRGARIVTDINLKELKNEKITAADIKYTKLFISLIKDIKNEGFNPDFLQHVKDFNLKHPHSFQTLADDVAKEKNDKNK